MLYAKDGLVRPSLRYTAWHNFYCDRQCFIFAAVFICLSVSVFPRLLPCVRGKSGNPLAVQRLGITPNVLSVAQYESKRLADNLIEGLFDCTKNGSHVRNIALENTTLGKSNHHVVIPITRVRFVLTPRGHPPSRSNLHSFPGSAASHMVFDGYPQLHQDSILDRNSSATSKPPSISLHRRASHISGHNAVPQITARVESLKGRSRTNAVDAASEAAFGQAATRNESTTALPQRAFSVSGGEFQKAQLVLSAAVTGGLTGVAVSLFKLSVSAVANVCYPDPEAYQPFFQGSASILCPAFGGMLVAIIRFLSKRNTIGPGLAEHVTELERSLPPQPAASVARSAAAVVTLGTGNSMGPEGPSVELGVAISRIVAPVLADRKQLSADERMRVQRQLLAAGAAAGVSAGFNAPLAGVFFALEVVDSAVRSVVALQEQADTSLPSAQMLSRANRAELDIKAKDAISSAAISALVAAIVTQELLGNDLALRPGAYVIQDKLVQIPLSLGLGAVSGAVALLFDRMTVGSRQLFNRIESKDPRFAEAVRPMVGGLICGIVGYAFPEVFFKDYIAINSILQTGASASSAVAQEDFGSNLITGTELLFAKLIATSVCVGSGLVGGTFAPAIFLGAVLGVAYQAVAGASLEGIAIATSAFQTAMGVPEGSWGMIPQLTLADRPSYALIGAGATLASVFRAPLTAVVLLFELTQKYDIVLPLLAASGTGPIVLEQLRELSTRLPYAQADDEAERRSSWFIRTSPYRSRGRSTGRETSAETPVTTFPPDCDIDNKMDCGVD